MISFFMSPNEYHRFNFKIRQVQIYHLVFDCELILPCTETSFEPKKVANKFFETYTRSRLTEASYMNLYFFDRKNL